MARKGWFDRLLKKSRDAGMDEEQIEKMRDEALRELPAEAFEEGDEGGDQHVHVHLHNGETHDDDEVPAATAAGAAAPVTREEYDALIQRMDALEAALNDEEDVELEDQDTQDRRRFKLRRGDKMTRDQDMLVPEVRPEMMGTTDLPGIENLNKKTTDSVSLETLWANTIAAAEIIHPGYRVPTFDAKHHPTLTAKRLCALRRGVMTEAVKDTGVAEIVHRFTADADLKLLPCDSVKIAFNATADAIKAERNGGAIRRTADAGGAAAPKVPTNREWNKSAAEFWANQGNGNGAVRH
jgi:hypothetical protein